MSNFHINFENPWLLLLLIPAVLVVLFPYFRIAKKYRKTRNRIVSMALHLAVMVLCVCVLGGMTFRYEVPNSENEVILLVDVSDSGYQTESDKNEFVREVIEEGESAGYYRLGIVTFGYGQVYAVELGNDFGDMYDRYIRSERPNTSGTDIASALRYASRLFTNPEAGKIILLSDGIETDGAASSVIRSIAAEGISVDTVYFPDNRTESEVQLTGIITPNSNVSIGNAFTLDVSVQSSYEGNATITLYDNDVAAEPVEVQLRDGVQTFSVEHTFTLPGMHELWFSIESEDDTLEQNNVFYSYMYLESYDDILILERTDGESAYLTEMLDEVFKVNVALISDTEAVPSTVDELRQYDEVILVNIANSDMPEGFIEILQSYVYDYGGGMFTVGGNRTDESGAIVANTYNRDDMYNTLYQEMLPVEAIDYTPPLGLMMIIDRSGSMESVEDSTQKTYLELAKEAAAATLRALDDRDYCGVMTLGSDAGEAIEMTPVPQMSKILAAIDSIQIGGGTIYSGALEAAGKALSTINVEKRHIIIISDGVVSGDDDYAEKIAENAEKGITLSIVTINPSSSVETEMRYAAETLGGGRYYAVESDDLTELTRILRNDLSVSEITDVNYETFTPQIRDHTAAVNGILQSEMPTLDGFYGTRVKETNDTDNQVQVALEAEYVPIYAQWKYGQGSVGSFMCDLSGVWSADFVNSPTGARFVTNVVTALFPTQNIKPQEIEVEFKDDNFTTQMSIYANLEDSESIDVTVSGPPEEGSAEPTVQYVSPSAAEGYSRTEFHVERPGLYTVLIEKKDAEGNVIASLTAYKTFSYSSEYNVFTDEDENIFFLEQLASDGNGAAVETPEEALGTLKEALSREKDPRMAFIITAIVLFLLDIAVRKFKFKWLHEIIRDRKAKKQLAENNRPNTAGGRI